MTSIAAGALPDSTVPITGEPKLTDSAELYLRPITTTEVDPDNHFNRDGTVAFIQDLVKQHAEAAPDRGVDFLVEVAAKHWGMNRNDPGYNTPIHIVPTHASTLQVLALS